MVTGSPSPLEELQGLRNLGRVMARDDPPSFLLRWSDDGQTGCYGDSFSLTMKEFQRLSRHFIDRAGKLCHDLMFDLDPFVDLDRTRDNMSNNETDFSFVSHPANKMALVYIMSIRF